jgi:hypothetical protein
MVKIKANGCAETCAISIENECSAQKHEEETKTKEEMRQVIHATDVQWLP